MSGTESAGAIPTEFADALASAESATFRTELDVTTIASPEGIAPYSAAWSATVTPQAREDGDQGTSRLVLLHDPAAPDAWAGVWRMVCFAKAPLDQTMSEDPLLPDVAWSWLTDALSAHGASFNRAAGTASTIVSTGLGEMASDVKGAEIELRASWSPGNSEVKDHLEAWAEFVCMLAGFPPTPDGVATLRTSRTTS
jgi:hypothetical protein